MSNSQWYAVYKLKFKLAIQDPDMPSPRYHTLIFVETNAEGSGNGTKFHVAGDIVKGMYYESKSYHQPEKSQTLHSKEFIGYTKAADFPQEWDALLKGVSAPPKQKAFNTKTMKTEPVKAWDPLTFYEPGESRKPLMKCTEWTEQQAIPALLSKGLITKSAS